MNNGLIVRYCYSELDKEHQYQIDNIRDTQNQWVWFYLGKYLKLRKNESLYPYSFDWKKTRKLGEYKRNSAKKRAKDIVNVIKKHRLIRS